MFRNRPKKKKKNTRTPRVLIVLSFGRRVVRDRAKTVWSHDDADDVEYYESAVHSGCWRPHCAESEFGFYYRFADLKKYAHSNDNENDNDITTPSRDAYAVIIVATVVINIVTTVDTIAAGEDETASSARNEPGRGRCTRRDRVSRRLPKWTVTPSTGPSRLVIPARRCETRENVFYVHASRNIHITISFGVMCVCL